MPRCTTVQTDSAADLRDTAYTPNTRICTRSIFFTIRRRQRTNAKSSLDRHFDIVNLSKIPTRKVKEIKDEPLIWRYFVTPLHVKLADSQLDEKEFVVRCVMRINTQIDGRIHILIRQKHGRVQGGRISGRCRTLLPSGRIRGIFMDGARPLSHQYAGMVGRRAPVCDA